MYDASTADYYRDRERAERELAERATSIAIRTIHLDLANRYREMAQDAQLNRTGPDRHTPPTNDASAADGEQARA